MHAIEEILLELDRLDVHYAPRAGALPDAAWWEPIADPVVA
jgi:hypothetical protein